MIWYKIRGYLDYKHVHLHYLSTFGEGLCSSFATPNPFVLTNKMCLNQDLQYDRNTSDRPSELLKHFPGECKDPESVIESVITGML